VPSKKIINQKFTILRNWLFPGEVWDSAPPDKVSDVLVNVVDTEHWIEVPRFQCHVASTAAGAGRASAIVFENFVRNPRGFGIAPPAVGNIASAVPTRFNITDLWARLAFSGTTSAGIYSRRKIPFGGGSFIDPINLDYFQGTYLIGGDADPFAGLYACDVGFPNAGVISLQQAGDAYTWVPLPDLSPGNGYVFVSQQDNTVMHIDFMWTERRPPGQPNVGGDA